jgi:hypothetical protein
VYSLGYYIIIIYIIDISDKIYLDRNSKLNFLKIELAATGFEKADLALSRQTRHSSDP